MMSLPGAISSIKTQLIRSLVVGKMALLMIIYNAIRNSLMKEVVVVHKIPPPQHHEHFYPPELDDDATSGSWWGRWYNKSEFVLVYLLKSSKISSVRSDFQKIYIFIHLFIYFLKFKIKMTTRNFFMYPKIITINYFISWFVKMLSVFNELNAEIPTKIIYCTFFFR